MHSTRYLQRKKKINCIRVYFHTLCKKQTAFPLTSALFAFAVPEYQVVPVRALSKRSAASEDGPHLVAHLEAFGRPLQLALRRTTGLAGAGPPSALRMWAQDGAELAEIPQAEHGADIGHTYQDEASGAALLVHTDPEDGTLLVVSIISQIYLFLF